MEANDNPDIWFNGKITEDENCPTIGQFLKHIENQENLNNEDKTSLAFRNLKGNN